MNSKESKVFGDLITEFTIDDIEEYDIDEYIRKLKRKINIETYPVKVKIIITSEFTTPMAFDLVESHYSHPIQVIKSRNNVSKFFRELRDSFEAWIDEYQERGSGFVFRNICSVKVKIHRYDYQRASSYLELGFKSKNIINVQNRDNKCFLWSILAKFYPAPSDKERVTKYIPYENRLGMEGIEYPVMIKDIPKVERQNNLSINVFSLEDQTDKSSLYPVYISDSESENAVDLLYLEKDGNSHYCLIKDLDSFRTDKNRHKQHTCRNCLRGFRTPNALENHKQLCLDHSFCKVVMPKEDKKILKFKNHHFMNKLPFAIYCDFESNNTPVSTCQPDPSDSYTNPIRKQTINSYGIYVHSDYPDIYSSQYFSYNGDDSAEKFVEKIIQIYKNLTYKMFINEKKTPVLTKKQERKHEEADRCYMCGMKFDKEKIREHDHLSGKYRGASCGSCNAKEGKTKIIPVFFHNGSNYDFHFLIEELMKYEDQYNKVQLLPKNSEEYISIDYGSYYKKLRFLDSYRFLLKSLSGVTESINAFPILEKEFHGNDISLLKQKGFYPYEYIDSIDRLQEKELPGKEKFYSTLTGKTITDPEYSHAQKVWETFDCKTLLDYHNLYLKTDVLLLADSFEKYRNFFLEHHQVDPCYCFSAPGLTWECGLKYTNVELELLTDYDQLLMFEKGIRGGFSGVLGPRHVKAFNKYTPNYKDKKRILDPYEEKELKEGTKTPEELLEEKFLLYVDANNLYGYAMSQELPTGDFHWEKNKDYYKNIPKGRGCIVECDLRYKDKSRTMKYPLAPEKRAIKEEELSEYQKDLLKDKPLGTTEKLLLTMNDKKKYVVHHRILKEYIRLGMQVTKVHRTISFKESAWLKKYIDFNTNERTKAKTLFEKDLWKLMNNSFYGKTLENIRGRSSVKLTTSRSEAKKSISKPNFKDSVIFNENFVAIINNVTSIKFNKPIYLGQAILDHSKLLMYQFYYDVIMPLWPRNQVVASDTDSLILMIPTKDLYEDLKGIQEHLDTSDYPKDHPLYSLMNKKVIGKFKDELNGKVLYEIIYLRSKVYSFILIDNTEEKKLKGISRVTIKNDLRFDHYKNCLYQGTVHMNKMYTLNSDKHQMFLNQRNKVSLNPFDDKRYILDDGIQTLPHGL